MSAGRGLQGIGINDRGWPTKAPPSRAWFDDLVATLEPELRRFVARKVPVDAVDDVLQEVWIAAWQAIQTYDRRSKFRTWIYGICVHKCHDRYRVRRMETRVLPIGDLELIDPAESPEQAAVRADTTERLLRGLGETSRDVIELYYYAQLTLAEIATVLGRNVNTVKYQFYRAHSDLLETGERESLR